MLFVCHCCVSFVVVRVSFICLCELCVCVCLLFCLFAIFVIVVCVCCVLLCFVVFVCSCVLLFRFVFLCACMFVRVYSYLYYLCFALCLVSNFLICVYNLFCWFLVSLLFYTCCVLCFVCFVFFLSLSLSLAIRDGVTRSCRKHPVASQFVGQCCTSSCAASG